MATSEGIPSSIDIEFLELNDNPYVIPAIWAYSGLPPVRQCSCRAYKIKEAHFLSGK